MLKFHSDIEEWLDYVRGFSSVESRNSMQKHLQNCQDCERTVLILERTIQAAKADRALDVPEQLVRNARAIFSRHSAASVPLLIRLLAKPVFDSLVQPALEGVRSLQQCEVRQMAYEAGDYRLEIRVESEPGTDKVVLIGQISNQRQADEHIAQVPVNIKSGSKILGRTVSNSFGEFLIEFVPKHSILLFIPLQDAGQEIEVQLDRLLQNISNAD